MDGFRFDRLTRTLTSAGSRRRALGGLMLGSLGLLGHERSEDAAAHDPSKKCKKKSGEAKKKCLKKAKKHNATHLVPPPPVCPPVCPVCLGCNGATGQCEALPNGQSALGCAAPHVCCGGTCCDPINQCNAAGTCATCAQVCPDTCSACFNLADGSTICGGASSSCLSGESCRSTDDCAAGKVCATSFTRRPDNSTSQFCGTPGACWTVIPCSSCPHDADACSGTSPCGSGGQCYRPFGGGNSRCGVSTGVIGVGSCGCTSHGQCETNHGAGSFCVTFTPGGACTCGPESPHTTFCALPR
jgi:hypothetical protein